MKVKINTNPKKNPIKKKGRCVLCVILRENKNAVLSWQPNSTDQFSIGKNTYFVDPKGAYVDDRGFIVSVYLEGSSLPIHHGCLSYINVKEKKIQKPNPFTGKMENHTIPAHTEIDTVKYDSGLIDLLLNRKLADVFTRVHLDMPNLVLAILLIVAVATGFVNIGLHFM